MDFMEGIVILLAVLVSLFIGYKYGKMKNSNGKKSTTKGKTIVIDRTPVDTSKEDDLKERFGDLD
jgi:hypothetical protein